MQARTLNVLILSLFSTALLLSIVLGVHIYKGTEAFEENEPAQWQLHKINFERPVSREEEREIKSSLYQLEDIYTCQQKSNLKLAVLSMQISLFQNRL